MKVKELLNLYSGYSDDIIINYEGEPYNEERHGGLSVRYFYPDHTATIHDGAIIIKDKLVIITE